MRGQMIATAVVMACGLAMMIMARSLILSLEKTQEEYYARHRFADVFADLKRAPNALRARLAKIPGVAAVETRVVGNVTLELPGQREPADGLIHSLPEGRALQLHQLYLRRGRLPEAGSRGEVVVGEAFAQAHGFQPGHTIDGVIHGARQRLKIVGIALSPEFVFEARPGDTLPDNKRFGVFWMNERELAVAFELDGAFNNVLIDLAPGGVPRSVMAEVDRLLLPYGGLVAYGRRDHPSASRLEDEIRILGSISVAFPAVFLTIAAFMSSAVLSRLIRLQREQIAQLKAFGYSSRAVGVHYLKFAVVIVAGATLLGGTAGTLLGTAVVQVYHRFFKFPELFFHPHWAMIGVAFVVSALAAFAGVIGAVREAVRLPPAEAMRPEPPARYRVSLLERLGLSHLVSTSFRMALRNIERRPWQSAFTAFGLALATGIPIVPGAMRDGIGHLLSAQWDRAERQDVTIALREPGSATALAEMRSLPGVQLAEPFRSVPVRLRFEHRSRRLVVTGLPADAYLKQLLDASERAVALPPEGLLISAKLAEVLGAKPGDKLLVEVQEGRRPQLEVTLQATLTDYSGLLAYMEVGALRRLMREGETVSGAFLTVDHAHWDQFLAAVRIAPRIAALSIKNSVRKSFQTTTADMIGMITNIYFGFAFIVSFGVVYNSARIALSERNRELATLRVVGFTQREVAGVLLSELAVLTVIALPFGLVIGSQMAAGIIHTASTEAVRLPLVLTPATFAMAVVVVLVSSTFSFALVSRRIQHLDLVGVLKALD